MEVDRANNIIFSDEKTEAQAEKATCQNHMAIKRWGDIKTQVSYNILFLKENKELRESLLREDVVKVEGAWREGRIAGHVFCLSSLSFSTKVVEEL